MRRILVTAATLAALCLGLPGAYARPLPAVPHISFDSHQRPVEQQTPGGATQPDRTLWVENPTECSWDADDALGGTIIGRWPKGYSAPYTDCVVGDWTPHLMFIDSEGVAATLTVGGAPVTITGSGCLIGPDYNNDPDNPLLGPIEGSGGGVGKVHTITWTGTNVSGKPLHEAGISFGLTLPWSNAAGSGSIESHCGVESMSELPRTAPGIEPVWWWSE